MSALEDLRAALAGAAAGADVTLTADLPGLTGCAAVWLDFLDRDVLTLKAASVTGAAPGPVVVTGGFDGPGGTAGVSATLYPTPGPDGDQILEILLVWTDPIPDLSPADAYLDPPTAEAPDTASQALLRGLTLGSARLLLSSLDFGAAAPAGATAPPALPALPDWLAGVAPGAGLTASGALTLPPALAVVLQPVAGEIGTPVVRARIGVAVNDLWLTLEHDFPLAGGPAFAPFGDTGPQASLTGLSLALPIDDLGFGRARASVAGRLVDGPAAADLTLTLDLVDRSAGLVLAGVAGQAPSLDWALGRLSLGAAPALPFDLGDITLARLEAEYDLAGRSMAAWSAAFATARPVEVFDGHVTVSPQLIISSQDGERDVRLQGAWTLGSCRIDTLIDVASGDIVATLGEGEVLDLAGFASGALPAFLTTDLAILDLDLHGNHGAGTFEVSLEAAGALALVIEGQTFSIGDLNLDLSYAAGAFTTAASGVLTLFGLPIQAAIDVSGDAWRAGFGVSAIDLKTLAEVFLSAVGTPMSTASLLLTDLALSVEQPGGLFHVHAALGAPISIAGSSSWVLQDAVFDARRDAPGPAGLSALLSADLVIAGLTVRLTADHADAKASFTGSTDAVLDIGALEADLAARLDLHLPDCLKAGVVLSRLAVDYSPSDSRLRLGCTGNLSLQGRSQPIDLTLDISPAGIVVSGALHVGDQLFALTVATGDGTRLTASWTGRATFADIAGGLGLGAAAAALPSDLSPTFTRADFTWDGRAVSLDVAADGLGEGCLASVTDGQARAYALGLTVGRDIDLTNLPQVGAALGAGEGLVVKGLHLVWSSAASADAARRLNAVLPDGLPRLAEADSEGALLFVAEVDAAGEARVYALPAPLPAAAPPAGAPAEPTPAAGFSKWFSVGRSFGPVQVARVGLGYRAGVLSLLLDAGLGMAGFELALKNLSIGSTLTGFDPQVSLDGLELSMSSGPLTLAGYFARGDAAPPVNFSYQGGLVLQLEDFCLTGIGSYADEAGQTSMFLYAEVRTPLGGPPYFYVTGLLGGFGYNSDVRLPDPDEVYKFPLVAGLSAPAGVGGAGADPMTVLAALLEAGPDGSPAWITVRNGQTWAAAGLEFTSFTLIDTKALFIIEFGDELKLRLVGLSTLQLPRGGTSPYAYAELQLEAGVDFAEGSVGASAILSPNSWVIDPACRLTGGFAFKTWWKGDYEGDFVVTLGGYHPAFNPPARYPRPPRLGFLWQVDDHLTISGSAYFALTPSAAMGGGALAVVYELGDLKAWLTAHADLLIEWKPFHFEASIGVSVGVSFRLNLLFTSVTVTLEVGADLDLWGPPTGGALTVHCWVVSFTIDFGADRVLPPPCQAWADVLPMIPRSDRFSTTAVAGGLQAEGPGGLWRVRGDLFAFTTESAAPASAVRVALPAAPGQTAADHVVATGAPIDIRPMGAAGVASTHRVTITRRIDEADVVVDLVAEGWSLEPRRRNVAAKLWSLKSPDGAPPPDDPAVAGRLAGLAVSPPRPRLGAAVGPVAETALAYEDVADPGALPALAPEAPRVAPAPDPQWLADIGADIASAAAGARRTAVLKAMADAGLALEDAAGPMTGFVQDLPSAFRRPPLIARGGAGA